MKSLMRLEDWILQNGLTPDQSRRIIDFNNSFSCDRKTVIQDKQLMSNFRSLVYDPRFLDSVLGYLENLRDKDGYRYSQSLKRVSQLVDVIDNFQSVQNPALEDDGNYTWALQTVKKRFISKSLHRLIYHSDGDMMDNLPKTNTHAGYSYIITGKRKKGEYREGIFTSFTEECSHAIHDGSFRKLILPGTRTQGSGAFEEETGVRTYTCKHKTRLVNMVDIMLIMAELIYAKPVQRMLSLNEMYAGGKSSGEITRQFSHLRNKYHWQLSIDYSGYDQTVPSWLLCDAFKLIYELFDEVDVPLWDVIVNDFIHKDLLFDGKIYHLDKGVPSGSMWTQIVDSICNWIVILTTLKSMGIDDESMMVMGDDNIIFSNYQIDSETLSQGVEHLFGMRIGDKSDRCKSTRESPHFLSRFWRFDGQWRHPAVLISKMAYPERFREYGDYGKEHFDVTPDEVIFGYICSYPVGMAQLMDINKFLRQHPNYSYQTLLKLDSRHLPGSIAYSLQYEKGKLSTIHI